MCHLPVAVLLMHLHQSPCCHPHHPWHCLAFQLSHHYSVRYCARLLNLSLDGVLEAMCLTLFLQGGRTLDWSTPDTSLPPLQALDPAPQHPLTYPRPNGTVTRTSILPGPYSRPAHACTPLRTGLRIQPQWVALSKVLINVTLTTISLHGSSEVGIDTS